MYSKLNVALAVALSGIISEIKRHIRQKSRFFSRVRVSTLTRDINTEILFVRSSVCLSVRNVPVLNKNGLTYYHSFFHHTIAQSF